MKSLDEETVEREGLIRLQRDKVQAAEEAETTNGVLLFKRFAKAWLWNSGMELEACIRALRGIKKTKQVLRAPGLFDFLVCKDESLTILLDREYAGMLQRTTLAWKKVVLDGLTMPEKRRAPGTGVGGKTARLQEKM